MEVGDLVRVRETYYPNQTNRGVVGVIVDKHKITSDYEGGCDGRILGIEYKVSLITNNKPVWYIEDSLELVNEGRRPC
jgi:hypothetical protein